MTQEETLSFEQAFHRLESILEKMNSQDVSLEDSLKLFQEADTLISICHTRLSDAEKRVEILVRERNGELKISENKKPETTPFVEGR
jgi:exodeoxyribonuclease VII small subunit